MKDILNYLTPSQGFAANYHLQGVDQAGKLRNPLWTACDAEKIVYYKSAPSPGAAGVRLAEPTMPCDVNTYDDKYVYLYQTENNWIPGSYKQYGLNGWRFAPRWLTGSVEPLVTTDTTYRVYQGTPEKPLSSVVETLGGPAVMSLGFDTPRRMNWPDGRWELTAEPLVITYQWGNLGSMEKFVYAPGYGWIEWQLWKLSNGIYLLSDMVMFNKIVAGGL